MKKVATNIALICITTATLGGLSGCGKEDPKSSLASAFQKTAQNDEQSVTLKVDSNPANLITIARQIAESNTSEDESAHEKAANTDRLTKIAKTLATTSITFEGKGQNVPTKPNSHIDFKDANLGMFVDMNGSRVASALISGGNLYAKTDADKIANETELFSSSQLSSFKQSANSNGAQWMSDLFSNKWIGLDSELSSEFTKNLNDKSSQGAKTQLTSDQQKKLRADMEKEIQETSTFKWQSDNVVDVNTDVKKLAQQFITDYKKDAPNRLTSADEKDFNDNLVNKIKPNAKFNSEWTVKDGKVRQAKFDVMQVYRIVDESKEKTDKSRQIIEKMSKYNLNLLISFSDKAPDLTAPKDYTKISKDDYNKVFGSHNESSMDDSYGDGSNLDNSYTDSAPAA